MHSRYKDPARSMSHQWLNLSLDILLMESNNAPMDTRAITEAYNISEQELNHILNNPLFQENHNNLKEWVTETSELSPVVIQSMIMSVNLKERLFLDAMSSDSISFSDKLKFLSELNKDIPRVEPKEQESTAPAIQINLSPNIRGMQDVTGTKVVGTFIDGEATEVDE